MKTTFISLKSCFALSALCLATPLTHAQFAASTGFDYTSGKYGLSTETKLSTWNITGEYNYEAWTARVVVPHERVSGPAGIIVVSGHPRLQKLLNAKNEGKTETETGLGDIELFATYDFSHRSQSDWNVALTGSVKLPSADEDKGLGTGKTDYSLALDLSRLIGRFTPSIGFGYRFIGNPSGADLRNYFYASVGGGYWITDDTNLNLTFESDQPSSASSNVDNELSLGLNHHVGKAWDLEAHLLAGLSESAPDFGAGVSVRYMF
jgi:hypothetical protein